MSEIVRSILIDRFDKGDFTRIEELTLNPLK